MYPTFAMYMYLCIVDMERIYTALGTVDSEKLKPYRAYIVHFVSLLKVLLSILHLNTIIALFFHF